MKNVTQIIVIEVIAIVIITLVRKRKYIDKSARKQLSENIYIFSFHFSNLKMNL
jgi:hypothetical protein